MASDAPNPPRVWGLLGQRRGDNQQVLALGAALGWPFTTRQLHYSAASLLPNVLRRSRPLGIRADPETPVAPPWPDLVISVGRRSAPLALQIRAATGGRCRLVQIGRPGAPLAWFDLIVTTPQYQLPAAPNVIEIPLPFVGSAPQPPATAAATTNSAGLLVVLVGGPTAELVFGSDEARALAVFAVRQADTTGATLAMVTSPRTPDDVAAALTDLVPPPHAVHVWRAGAPNPYRELLAAADRILVTADSVSMLADACRSNAAVDVFPLPETSHPLRRLADRAFATVADRAGRRDPLSRLLASPLTSGLVPAPRRYDAVADALVRRGLLGAWGVDPVARHAAIVGWENHVVARIRSLLPTR